VPALNALVPLYLDHRFDLLRIRMGQGAHGNLCGVLRHRYGPFRRPSSIIGGRTGRPATRASRSHAPLSAEDDRRPSPINHRLACRFQVRIPMGSLGMGSKYLGR
jgi:hypothetical protein